MLKGLFSWLLKTKLAAFFVFSISAVLLCWLLLQSDIVAHQYELTSWRWRQQRLSEVSEPAPNIKIIQIDQPSLDYFAASPEDGYFWPWPRSLNVPIIEFLKRGGARAIAFDMIYSETSTHQVEDDQAFAEAVAKFPTVISVVLQDGGRLLPLAQRETLQKYFPTDNQLKSYPQGTAFRSITIPIPELLPAATKLANVSAVPDNDGIFRRFAPTSQLLLDAQNNGTVQVPSLPLALYTIAYGKPPALSPFTFDPEGLLNVRFYGREGTFPTYSFAQVFYSARQLEAGEKPRIDPAEFKDSLVIVGPTAPGLMDLRPTPLSKRFPGVEYNATVVSNLAKGDFIVNAGLLTTLLYTLVFALATAATCLFVSRTFLMVSLLTLIGLAMFWTAMVATYQGVWLPFAAPGMSLVIMVLAALSYQYGTEGAQRRFLKEAFKHYVSEDLVSQIVANPSSLSLGGQKRELTIFFSDIEGFTKLSERIEPTKLVALLNQFLSSMTEIIMRHNGTLDKYVGDAIVAFWNAPLDVSEHAQRGVIAALECQRKLAQLQESFVAQFGVNVRMRIGLNTGLVSVGNFGSLERFNYTMIGDAANLASRLEGANKYFGTYTLMTEETFRKLPAAMRTREVGAIRVVGREAPVTIYEPLSDSSGLDINVYYRALKEFQAGHWEIADQIFSQLPQDPVSKAYRKRIAAAHSGANRDPIWNLSEK